MQFERRMVSLLLLLAVLGAPAVGLRLMCAGRSCDRPVRSTATIPFCSLPPELRDLIGNGFREGRSPDVIGVTSETIAGGTYFDKGETRPEWPSLAAVQSTRVPIAFRTPDLGVPTGGRDTGTIPPGTGSDDIAPTIAKLMGLERPHPDVRSGRAIAGAAAAGDANIRLVLQIVWKGVGSADLERDTGAWPTARALIDGFGTMDGRIESLPADPAAVLTTIGTGGIPAQHGITGSILRDETGRLRQAWSQNAPVSVIAGLGDDVDELTAQDARVGMVAEQPTDRGLIGQNWYVEGDEDDFVVTRVGHEAEEAVERLVRDGFGDDETPDLLAVALQGPLGHMDDATRQIIKAVIGAIGEDALAVAFTTTGSVARKSALPAAAVARQVERAVAARPDVVSASSPGGIYLDQDVIAQQAIDDDEILTALKRVKDASGAPVFEDVFPAIAVSFGRYCR